MSIKTTGKTSASKANAQKEQALKPPISGQHGDPRQALQQLIMGYRMTQMLYTTAKLMLADHLASGPKTAGELAELTGAHAPSLYRLLRALASLGIFVQDEQGAFAPTPMSDLLRKDKEGSLRAMALFSGRPSLWAAAGDMLNSVMTGDTAFQHVHGMSMWVYNELHPEDNALCNAFFSMRTLEHIRLLDGLIDFSSACVVMDVAGGQGRWLAHVLKGNPHLRGILFDQPHVVDEARALMAEAGLLERCEVISGSFFAGVPQGADTIMLKNIIHDWPDDAALSILRNCRQALPETGRLLVIDGVIFPGNNPDLRKLMDIQMLLTQGGHERTEAEWRELLSQAGFRLERILRSDGEINVIEGRPVPEPV